MREQAQNSSQGLENKKSKQIHGTSLQILPPKNLATRPKTIMLLGKSGCGKSDLAFRLISQGRAKLISDDQTIIERRQNALFASAPKSIFGKLEIRHIGIVKIGALKTGKLDAIIYLETSPKKIERLPGPAHETLLDIQLPYHQLYSFDHSIFEKLEWLLFRAETILTDKL